MNSVSESVSLRVNFPRKKIVYLSVDNRFDEILLVFSLFESDVRLQGLGDHFRIVDKGVFLVDTTAVASSPFLRRDEIVSLSFTHISQVGVAGFLVGVQNIGEVLIHPVCDRTRNGVQISLGVNRDDRGSV